MEETETVETMARDILSLLLSGTEGFSASSSLPSLSALKVKRSESPYMRWKLISNYSYHRWEVWELPVGQTLTAVLIIFSQLVTSWRVCSSQVLHQLLQSVSSSRGQHRRSSIRIFRCKTRAWHIAKAVSNDLNVRKHYIFQSSYSIDNLAYNRAAPSFPECSYEHSDKNRSAPLADVIGQIK